MDFAEHPRIAGVGLGQNVDAVLAAQGNLGLDVDLLIGPGDLVRKLRPHALHGSKFAGAARQRGRAVPNRSSSALRIRGPTPEITQPQHIDQFISATGLAYGMVGPPIHETPTGSSVCRTNIGPGLIIVLYLRSTCPRQTRQDRS